MDNSVKSEQLQIRVSPQDKKAILRAAAEAGVDMSAYVLSRVLSAPAAQFQKLAAACSGPESRYALAELNALLAGLSARKLQDAVEAPPRARLTALFSNYIAAMVELACAKRGLAIPVWTRAVVPLSEPFFASSLKSLRLYLLTHSPPPFRLRNIFIDASVGDRI